MSTLPSSVAPTSSWPLWPGSSLPPVPRETAITFMSSCLVSLGKMPMTGKPMMEVHVSHLLYSRWISVA
eukprot:CAMPEP_0185561204 /NCGR_PEP_ID=MMETSP1381-20130426/58627_1 /TAXON_ID=298111 /ORGANISM="Pavlova sp., Strain CCMP459" /LENGTH=68 /DNA_ID=CAMNT_0028174961 /DNA_START=191 /DNA_END=394 /DNA_ORIENTATION=+